MKAKYLLIALLLVSFTAFAKDAKVPKPVKDSFSKLYPKVTHVKWDKEGTDFEASFKVDGKDMSVLFSKDAILIETETEVETSQLPQAAQDYISANFKDYKIKVVAKIVKVTGGVSFEAEITKGSKKKELFFDANGKLEKGEKDNN